MKTFSIIFVMMLLGLKVFASPQTPDKIIYNGKEYKLYSHPLEPFFKKNPDRKPEVEISSTGLTRGYVATFEIRNNQLFLKDIEIENRGWKNSGDRWKTVMDKVFPNQKNVKINWLTGLLVLPYGKPNYDNLAYGSVPVYENYIVLEFDKGDLKKEKHFTAENYEKFKEQQFLAFKQTEDYRKISDKLRKKDSEEKFDSFLKIHVTEYSSKILIE